MKIARLFPLTTLVAAALVAGPAHATVHLMQIEQVIGGVNGDTTAQAIQLRMRGPFQNQTQNAKLWAWDAQGLNPVLLIDFLTPVPNEGVGVRVLVASLDFANYTSPPVVPDFTMTNLIPASYLAAGSITFENNLGSLIWWRLSWGGANYTGSTTGAITNDPDGEFGPPYPGPLPSSDVQALQFQGLAGAASSNNAADYALTGGPAVFSNNAGASFTITAPAFTDVTATAGVGLPGELNESVAWGDYDNDGDQDLYLTNNGTNRLFRNDGGDVFTDVTGVAGVGHPGFSVGTAFGDLDNDGDLDLYVVNFGSGTDVLYRNDGPVGPGGEYVFTDVTLSAGTTIERSSRGMALLDFDRDGLIDIYVMAIGEYILYHNLGNLQFVDVAAGLGVNASETGVGVVCTDVDNNGWIDIFTGNRSGAVNSLYLNDHGTFADIAAGAGINATGLGMGVLSFDYDNDLDFDLYWTTWPGSDPGGPQPNALYQNVDGTNFTDVALVSGTTDPDGWGISCNAGDIDNDGWQDFFVTNGFDPNTTANVLFHNQSDGTFTDVTPSLGGAAFDGRGVAFADYDNDGDVDLVVTADAGDSTRLWRNDTNNGNHWITLNLVGTVSNRSAIGARIEVTTALMTTVQEVSGGAGRGSQNSLPVEFGLGSAETVEQITVFWPSGGAQAIENAAVDQILTVTEPLWGDMNCDGVLDGLDVGPFVLALTDPPSYEASYPDCAVNNADVNADRAVDVFDVEAFVELLVGSQ